MAKKRTNKSLELIRSLSDKDALRDAAVFMRDIFDGLNDLGITGAERQCEVFDAFALYCCYGKEYPGDDKKIKGLMVFYKPFCDLFNGIAELETLEEIKELVYGKPDTGEEDET